MLYYGLGLGVRTVAGYLAKLQDIDALRPPHTSETYFKRTMSSPQWKPMPFGAEGPKDTWVQADDKWVNTSDDFWFELNTISPPAFTVTVTGQDATFTEIAGSVVITMTAEQGVVAITGQAARLQWSHALKVVQGSVSINGQTARLASTKNMQAAQGSIAIALQPAIIAWHRKAKAEQGAVSISGQTARLQWNQTLDATQAAVAITFQDAFLGKVKSIAAGQGSVAITASDVSLTWHHSVKAEQGSIAITGQDADADWHQAAKAEQGAVSINGQDVVFKLRGRPVIVADQGSIAITGQDAGMAEYAAYVPPVIPVIIGGTSRYEFALQPQNVVVRISGLQMSALAGRVSVETTSGIDTRIEAQKTETVNAVAGNVVLRSRKKVVQIDEYRSAVGKSDVKVYSEEDGEEFQTIMLLLCEMGFDEAVNE